MLMSLYCISYQAPFQWYSNKHRYSVYVTVYSPLSIITWSSSFSRRFNWYQVWNNHIRILIVEIFVAELLLSSEHNTFVIIFLHFIYIYIYWYRYILFRLLLNTSKYLVHLIDVIGDVLQREWTTCVKQRLQKPFRRYRVVRIWS